MNNYTIIASVFRANLDTNTNLERHENCMKWLIAHNLCDFKTVIGVYQEEGQAVASREVSLMISNLTSDEATEAADYYLHVADQDCVLVMEQDSLQCHLVGSDWKESIGRWTCVTMQEAHRAGIYTLDTNGKYWVAC